MALSTMNSNCIGDTPRSQRQFRRVLVVAALCLLLGVVASIVWYVNRPLTDVEQRLVGTWRNTTSPRVFTFRADRSTIAPGFPAAVWHMRGNTLHTRESLLVEVLHLVFRGQAGETSELTFEDDDNVSVFNPSNGVTIKWQRVSPQPSSINK